MIKLIIYIFYFCFCLVLAEDNATKIQKGIKIKHFFNGLLHFLWASVTYYFFGFKAGVSVLLIGRVTFDTALNIFRDLPIDYVSPNPKSIVDRVEKYLFNSDYFTPKIIYLAILICLQII